MKKTIKIAAGVMALILIGGILWFANGLVGNPVSKMLSNRSANQYIKETYPHMELEASKTSYDFKTGTYYVKVKSKTSVDTHFSLNMSASGKVVRDLYENSVLGKFNTWNRINSEYRALVEAVFGKESFPYASDVDYGELCYKNTQDVAVEERPFGPSYGLSFEKLEIDKIYNIEELGKTAGHVVFYAESEKVNAHEAGEILLDIKSIFDAENVPFFAIDVILSMPRTGEEAHDENRETFSVNSFLYSDIYEENLTNRLEVAAQALQAYYAEASKEKPL